MSQNLDTVRGVHEAFEREDIPGLLELLADDVQWVVPETLPWGGSYSGRDEVGGFFASLPDHFDELVVTPDELLDAGDAVVDIGRFGGRSKSGGELGGVPYVFIWKLRDGKVASFHEYGDTALYLEKVQGQVTA